MVKYDINDNDIKTTSHVINKMKSYYTNIIQYDNKPLSYIFDVVDYQLSAEEIVIYKIALEHLFTNGIEYIIRDIHKPKCAYSINNHLAIMPLNEISNINGYKRYLINISINKIFYKIPHGYEDIVCNYIVDNLKIYKIKQNIELDNKSDYIYSTNEYIYQAGVKNYQYLTLSKITMNDKKNICILFIYHLSRIGIILYKKDSYWKILDYEYE